MAELEYAERMLSFIDILPGSLQVTADEFDRVKHSSTYRFLCIIDGECRLFLSGESFLLEKNDFCFFRPGDLYQTMPVKNMQVLNLYFSFDKVNLSMIRKDDVDHIDTVKRYDVVDCPVFNQPFLIKHFPQGVSALQEILREHREGKPYTIKKKDLLLNSLALDVVQYRENLISMQKTDDTVARIINYIRRHIYEKLTCNELAERFSYHPNYLNQLLIRSKGVSLHRYILNEKIRCATSELMMTDKTIAEIAQEYAFYDSSHFARSYYLVTGLRPSDVRKAAMHTGFSVKTEL